MDRDEPGRPATSPIPAEPEALRQDIELTRQELAETLDALAWKTDVSNRAREKAHELRARAEQNQVAAAALRQPRITAAGVVGALLLIVVGMRYLSRRRSVS